MTIAWLPAHPAMGWASMNRCWHALDHQAIVSPPGDLHFVCPLKLQPIEQLESPAWKRHWTRHLSYPLRVKAMYDIDAVHILDHSFADLLRYVKPGVKKIVTVHDIIPLLDPTGLADAQVRRFRQRLTWLHQADLILCVSEFTRQTLSERLQLSDAKLRVLLNGVELPTSKAEDDTRSSSLLTKLPSPKILIVGSNLNRKNLQLIPEMLGHLKAQRLTPSIIRVGPEFSSSLKQAILSIISAEHLIELGLVSDDTLSAAYRAADLLFFPSKLEGFGLPVLEAMAHGCPVVCSNSSSLPEVGGDAALYFDPNDAAAAALQCASVAQERARLTSAGLERAKQFTWAQHWTKLCDLYRSL